MPVLKLTTPLGPSRDGPARCRVQTEKGQHSEAMVEAGELCAKLEGKVASGARPPAEVLPSGRGPALK